MRMLLHIFAGFARKKWLYLRLKVVCDWTCYVKPGKQQVLHDSFGWAVIWSPRLWWNLDCYMIHFVVIVFFSPYTNTLCIHSFSNKLEACLYCNALLIDHLVAMYVGVYNLWFDNISNIMLFSNVTGYDWSSNFALFLKKEREEKMMSGESIL